jgi:hypothetical protein
MEKSDELGFESNIQCLHAYIFIRQNVGNGSGASPLNKLGGYWQVLLSISVLVS